MPDSLISTVSSRQQCRMCANKFTDLNINLETRLAALIARGLRARPVACELFLGFGKVLLLLTNFARG
jgi:hypothetical protein